MPTTIQYALMAAASYISTRPDENKFPVPEGWDIGIKRVLPSGFEAATFSNGTELVISFAGTYPGKLLGPTNSLGLPIDFVADLDLGLGYSSDQLLQAVEYYLDRKRENPGATITLTGHSLGGGLASLVGVFFGLPAVTFDQAPFANSAQDSSFISNPLNLLVPDVATKLKADLLTSGYTEAELSPLSNYLTIRPTGGGIPNANLVNTTRVDGEFLSDWVPISMYDIIGNPATIIRHGVTSATGIDLHSQSLLIAFLQSDEVAKNSSNPEQTLSKVTYKLTDLLTMFFDARLFSNSTDTTAENFLERLVRHEFGNAPLANTTDKVAADAMLTRFTRDLWKLAQDGGLTLADGNGGFFSSPTNFVSKALTAFAMQKYYEETDKSAGYNKELFTAENVTGGIRFDMADVSAKFNTAITNDEKLNLTEAKGYDLYFRKYLGSDIFTDSERSLILSLLPYMRDWTVQAGASGMNAADTLNRGAFMLGGNGADTLVGGSGIDLLVGNGGVDTLSGGKGNDTLLGGAGADTYVYTSGDGLDTILDADGGTIYMDGSALTGGAQYGDNRVHRSADGKHLYVQADAKTLIIDGNIIVSNYSANFGLAMTGAVADTTPQTTRTILGDRTGGALDDLGNATGDIVVADKEDMLYGSRPDVADPASPGDKIDAGGGNDVILADRPNFQADNGLGNADWLMGGAGRDDIVAGAGNDLVEAGADGVWIGIIDGQAISDAGGDLVYGGEGNDEIYGDTRLNLADAIAQVNPIGMKGDFLAGGAGDDTIVGARTNDVLTGGGGSDLLIGGAGDDNIYGDAGYAALRIDWKVTRTVTPNNYESTLTYAAIADNSAGGVDVIYGGAGEDWAYGGAENDFIDGGSDNDVLFGEAGNDILLGGDGNDVLVGDNPGVVAATSEGADYLDGGIGDDILQGNGGDDILIGGKGNDNLYGGAGRDTYIYNVGDGIDHIYDTSDNDKSNANILRFGAGVNKDNIKLGLGSLLLDMGNGDKIHIDNFNQTDVFNSVSIGSFEFDDGSVLTSAEFFARGFDIDGTEENDDGHDAAHSVLAGTNVTDRIRGAGGNDVLAGFDGNDTLDGGSGDDELQGGDGNDLLIGGLGNDTLFGQGGNDVFELNVGDGRDIIVDSSGANLIRFGSGIFPEDLTVSLTNSALGPQSLSIQYGSTDQVTVTADSIAAMRYEFTDGRTLSYSELLRTASLVTPVYSALDNSLYGTREADYFSLGTSGRIVAGNGNDISLGSNGDDVIEGGGGNDVLYGNNGADTLQGGIGNDWLNGGFGSDTYLFSRGDGQDTIIENNAGTGDVNSLKFGPDILAVDVTYTRQANGDLVIGIKNSTDSVTIKNWYANPANQLERIVYGDGSLMDVSSLAALTVPAIVAERSSTLNGTIYDDVLIGGAGDDVLNGGLGSDTLMGGAGSDTYQLDWGRGRSNWGVVAPDTVIETGSEMNTIRLPMGLDFSGLTFERQGNDLYLGVQGSRNVDYRDLEGSNTQGSTGSAPGAMLIKDYYSGTQSWQVQTAAGELMPMADLIMQMSLPTADLAQDAYVDWLTSVRQAAFSDFMLAGARQTGDYRFEADYGWTSDHYTYALEFAYSYSDAAGVYRASDTNKYETAPTGTYTVQLTSPNYVPRAEGSGNTRIAYYDYGNLDGYGNPTFLGFEIVGNGVLPGSNGATFATLPPAITVNRSDVYQATVVESLQAGAADNVIDINFGGAMAVDAGAGNDTIWAPGYGGYYPVGDFLNGGDGDDRIFGSLGNDVILAGNGNDFLSGDQGDDTYLINTNDTGTKVIDEVFESICVPGVGCSGYGGGRYSSDTVEFGPGVTPEDLVIARGTINPSVDIAGMTIDPGKTYKTLDFTWGAGTQTVRVVLPEAGSPYAYPGGLGIERFRFADGTILTMGEMLNLVPMIIGTDGSEILYGTVNNDVIYGKGGNDIVSGGLGNDRYLFNLGDGVDRIIDTGGTDTIQFGPGITPDSLTLGVGSLLVRVGGDGDAIHIEGFDPSDALASPVIENFQFADGTALTYEQLLAKGFDLSGSGMVTGTNLEDRITGSDGNDVLDGGQGDDVIAGGAGQDSYIFKLGDGNDTLFDAVVPGENNLIVFGDGIFRDSLRFEQDTGGLRIRYGDTDSVLLAGYDPAGNRVVAKVEFADGSAASLDELMNTAPVAVEPLAGQLAMEDTAFAFVVPVAAFSDPDAGDVLTYMATSESGGVLPEWLAFDPVTRAFGGTPVNSDVGQFMVKVIATDRWGKSAEQTFNLVVANVNDAPVLTIPLVDQTVRSGAGFLYQLPSGSFADVDQGDTLSYSAKLADGSALPGWLKFDSATQTFSGQVPNSAKGSLDIQVVASDGHGAGSIASDVFRVSFTKGRRDGHGNEGVGNGQDAPPPGHDHNWNDGPGTSPGHPGSRDDRGDDGQSKTGRKACGDEYDGKPEGDDRNRLFSAPYLDLKKLDRHVEAFSGGRREADTSATVARWIEVDLAVSRQRAMEDKNLPWLREGNGADIAVLHHASAGFLGSKTGCGADDFSLAAGAGTQLKAFRGLQEGMRKIA